MEGTDVGKIKASHALAKIAAISNPDIAFPGERVSFKIKKRGEKPLVLLLFFFQMKITNIIQMNITNMEK